MKKRVMSLSVMAITAPLLLGASPADASTKWSYKSSELSASAEFSFAGTIDGFDGNVHTGRISGTDGGDAYASISSWTCEEGSWPDEGYYGYGYDDGCTLEDSNYLVSYDGEAVVEVDKKLDTATISGTMSSYSYSYYDEPSTSEPTDVSVTFTGVGATRSSTEYSSDEEFSYKSATTTRSATVTGTIGSFDLAAADSYGELESTKTFERYHSK